MFVCVCVYFFHPKRMGSCGLRHRSHSGNLPDLVIDAQLLTGSLCRDRVAVHDTCLVEEGCVTSTFPPERDVIRFSLRTWNRGEAALESGSAPPETAECKEAPPPPWNWHECHAHWHYQDFMEYGLFASDGTVVTNGLKQGWCVMDTACDSGASPAFEECGGDQGISANCHDTYGWDLDCQWVDITDALLRPTATYVLNVTVNPNRSQLESSYDNNGASTRFRLADIPACVHHARRNGVEIGLGAALAVLLLAFFLAVAYSARKYRARTPYSRPK